jgi:hypothetical protein
MNAIKGMVLGSVLVVAGCATTAQQTMACSPGYEGTEVRSAHGGRCECTVNREDAAREDCEFVGPAQQISRADPR